MFTRTCTPMPQSDDIMSADIIIFPSKSQFFFVFFFTQGIYIIYICTHLLIFGFGGGKICFKETSNWKAIESSKGPDIMGFNLMSSWSESSYHRITVCLIHEEIVAGEMSLSSPFLKETKTNSLFYLRSEALSK